MINQSVLPISLEIEGLAGGYYIVTTSVLSDADSISIDDELGFNFLSPDGDIEEFRGLDTIFKLAKATNLNIESVTTFREFLDSVGLSDLNNQDLQDVQNFTLVIPKGEAVALSSVQAVSQHNMWINYDGTGPTGFNVEGTIGNDTIKLGAGGDRVNGGEGDDRIDLGASGSNLSDWSSLDTVNYNGKFNLIDFKTGKTVEAFSIEKNEFTGEVTVTDDFRNGLNEGTDILQNVDVIRFGDGTSIFLNTRHEIHTWTRHDGDGGSTRVSRDFFEGSKFDDVIEGGQYGDRIEAGDGNDVIWADGSALSIRSEITIAGGDGWRHPFENSGLQNIWETMKADFVDTEMSVDFGLASRVRWLSDEGSNAYHQISGTISGDVKLLVTPGSLTLSDTETFKNSIASVSDQTDFVAAVYDARDSGLIVELLVEHSHGGNGFALLDVRDPREINSRDEILGQGGNDFIDGGLKGETDNPGRQWEADSYAQFSGKFNQHIVKKITSDPNSTTFQDGSTVAEFAQAAKLSGSINILSDLVVALELDRGVLSDKRVEDNVVLVADKIAGRNGIDIVSNVQALSFDDRWVNLDIELRPYDDSEHGGVSGVDSNGTIFNDYFATDLNSNIDPESFNGSDRIHAGSGNDIVLSGAEGDRVTPGSGYDFVDMGSSGSDTKNWEEQDILEINGPSNRYTVEQISSNEVQDYLSDGSQFDLTSSQVTALIKDDQSYFRISDKSITYGDGVTVATNVDRINFNDTDFALQTGVNDWLWSETDDWSGIDYNNLYYDIRAEGTEFNNIINLNDQKFIEKAPLTTNDWQLLLDDDHSNVTGVYEEFDYSNVRFRAEAGAGDDVIIGRDGFQSKVEPGAGNDIVVAGLEGTTPADGAFPWWSENRIEYNSASKERVEILDIRDDVLISSSGKIYEAISAVNLADVAFDLTDLDQGIIRNGSGKVLVDNLGDNAWDEGVILIDSLPSELGGVGVDLIFGFDRIDFSDDDVRLEAGVELKFKDYLYEDGGYRLDVRSPELGGAIDLVAIADTLSVPDADVVIASDFKGSSHDDVFYGLSGRNEGRLLGGDDIFIIPSVPADEPDPEISASDPWDFYDTIKYPGASSRYEIEKVVVTKSDGTDLASPFVVGASGEVEYRPYVASASLESDELVAVRVRDSINDGGQGEDFLVGVDRLRFADDEEIWINVRAESRVRSDDFKEEYSNDFTDALDIHLASDQRFVGTPFDDVIVGNKLDWATFTEHRNWSSVDLGQATVNALIDAGKIDGLSVMRNWMEDDTPRLVGTISDTKDKPDGSEQNLNSWTAKIFHRTLSEDKLAYFKDQFADLDANIIDAGTDTNVINGHIDYFFDNVLAPEIEGDSGAVVELRHADPDTQMNLEYVAPFTFYKNSDDGLDIVSYLNLGRDSINAGDGNDTIILYDGDSHVNLGKGDDIVFGDSSQDYISFDKYFPEWRQARVEFAGSQDRYDIQLKYGLIDNFSIVDGYNGLVDKASELIITGNQYISHVVIVADTLQNMDLNTGTDLLVGIREINFTDADFEFDRRVDVEDSNWLRVDYNEVLGGETFTRAQIWNPTDFDDFVDLTEYYQKLNTQGQFDDVVEILSSKDGSLKIGAVAGRFDVASSGGNDTYIGYDEPGFTNNFIMKEGTRDDYNFSKGKDGQGEYVLIETIKHSSVSTDFNSVKLYNFDVVEMRAENNEHLFIDTVHDFVWAYQNGDRIVIDTSILDDHITQGDIDAAVHPEANLQKFVSMVHDNEGNDVYEFNENITYLKFGGGTDTVDLGAGFDMAISQAAPDRFEIKYWTGPDIDTLTEISYGEYVSGGIHAFYGGDNILGTNTTAATIISQELYEARYNASLTHNYDSRDLKADGTPTVSDEEFGLPGWFATKGNYFVSLTDVSNSGSLGETYLKGTEAVYFKNTEYGDVVYDIVTNEFYADVPFYIDSSSELLNPQLVFTPQNIFQLAGGDTNLPIEIPGYYAVLTSSKDENEVNAHLLKTVDNKYQIDDTLEAIPLNSDAITYLETLDALGSFLPEGAERQYTYLDFLGEPNNPVQDTPSEYFNAESFSAENRDFYIALGRPEVYEDQDGLEIVRFKSWYGGDSGSNYLKGTDGTIKLDLRADLDDSGNSNGWAVGILDDFIQADILIDSSHDDYDYNSPNLYDFTSSQKGILQFVTDPSTGLVRDWTVLKDGDTIQNEPVISEIKSILTALSNETPYTLLVQDGFNDSDNGTDIFYGGEHDLGADGKFEITTDHWKTIDLVYFAGLKEDFEIYHQILNSEGKISNLIEGADWYNVVVGKPNEPYVKVFDTTTSERSGHGTDYLFGIEKIYFENNGEYNLTQWRLDIRDDAPNKIRFESGEAYDEVNFENDSYFSSFYNSYTVGDPDKFYVNSVEIEASAGDDFFVGFDQQGERALYENWTLDRINFSSNSSYFEIEKTSLVQNADGTFLRKADGTVKTFSDAATAPPDDGTQTVKDAVVVRDTRGGVDNLYGSTVLVDFERVSFTDQSIDLRMEVSTKLGDWNLWLGGDNRIPEMTWHKLNLDSRNLEYDLNVDGKNIFNLLPEYSKNAIFADLSQDDIKFVNFWSNGTEDDVIVVQNAQHVYSFGLNTGNDFIFLSDDTSNTIDHAAVSQFDLWQTDKDQFEIDRVYVELKADLTPYKTGEDWVFHEDLTTDKFNADATLHEAILLEDVTGDYGSKLIVGVGRINFQTGDVNTALKLDFDDWDGDGQYDWHRVKGTIFDEKISYDPNDQKLTNTQEIELDGGAGDDILVGQGRGERFDGGSGDDIILGGGEGSTDNWHDLDRVDYNNINLSDLIFETTTVQLKNDGTDLYRGNNGQVSENATSAEDGYSLVKAVIVQDKNDTIGRDILVDIERLDTSDRGVRLQARINERDNDGDGQVDEAGFDGGVLDDLIDSSTQNPELLELDNWFNVREGNDTIFGGKGGDHANLGTGDDIFIGGADGAVTEWGWVRRDNVRFEKSKEFYDLDFLTWKPGDQAQEIKGIDEQTVYIIDQDGKLFRASNTTSEVFQISEGEQVVIVRDKLPSDKGLGGEGVNLLIQVEEINFSDQRLNIKTEYNKRVDDDGNILHSWINGTLADETLNGTIARDHIQDGAGNDTAIGGLGSDHFNIGSGIDTIFGDEESSSYNNEDHDQVRFDGEYDRFILSQSVDVEGREYLEVIDKLEGEFGFGVNRLYDIEAVSFEDRHVEVGISRYERDFGGGIKGYDIRGTEFSEVITGTDFGDNIYGNAGDDTLIGGIGGDHFNPGPGNNLIYGGAEGFAPWGAHQSVDIVNFDFERSDASILFYDGAGQNVSNYVADGYIEVSVEAGVDATFTNTLFGIERINFDGSQMSFESSYGYEDGKYIWRGTDKDDTNNPFSDLNERFYGNDGDDIIKGGLGNDDFIGGAGNDTFYGNSDASNQIDQDELGNNFVDTVIYSEFFSDFHTIEKSSLITGSKEEKWTVESSFSGNDTLFGIEIIKFGDRTERLLEQEILRDTDKDGVEDLQIIQGTLEDNDWTLLGWNAEIQTLKLYGGAGDDSAFLANIANTVFDDLGVNQYTGGDTSKDVFVAQTGDWSITENVTIDGTIWDVEIKDTSGNITYLNDFERLELAGDVFNLKTTSSTSDRNGDGVEDVIKIFGSDSNNIAQDLSALSVLGKDVGVGSRLEIYGNKGDDHIFGSNNVTNILSGGEGNDQLNGGNDSKDIALMDGKFGDYDELVEITGGWSITHSETQETDTLTNIDFVKFADRVESLQMQSENFEVFALSTGIQTVTKLTGTNRNDMIQIGKSDDKIVKSNDGNDTISIAETFSGKLQITDFDDTLDTLKLVVDVDTNSYIDSIQVDEGAFLFKTSDKGSVTISNHDSPFSAVIFEQGPDDDTVLLVDGSAMAASNQYTFDGDYIDKIIIDVAGQFVSEDWTSLNITETEGVGKIGLDGFDLVFTSFDATVLSNTVELI